MLTRERFEHLLSWPPSAEVPPPNERDATLIADIEAAFTDDPPLGDGLKLFQGEEVDSSRCVFPEIRLYDYVERWQDVRDDHIDRFGFAFCFLDGRGQRFYLPALMRWELRWAQHLFTAAGQTP